MSGQDFQNAAALLPSHLQCRASGNTPGSRDEYTDAAVIERAAPCSSFVWTPIEGYEPMENCHTADGEEVGWIRPAKMGKTRPQPWGTAADWPGEWEAIPHRYDEEGQPLDWQLSTNQPSYAAAKECIERGWTNH